ncbi:MAG: VWA domain-containing protein [Bifidobacteriaceae bacterium]|nr:VWA domain-containing protein [Bifidobacteriaceae bacterium]
MSFAYPWLLAVLPALAAAALALAARRRRGSKAFAGTRLANTAGFAGLPGYAAIARQHHVSAAIALAAAGATALGAVALAARPVSVAEAQPQNRSRDVVLCLDVSGSMYPVDAEVIGQFREIVAGFDGERVAMSWFNSSSVTLFPLTDDYAFIEQTLAPLEGQFEAVSEALTWDDWMELDPDAWPDDSGTLLGEGSSLPGDGLMSCLTLFDDSQVERPRSVILATDNVVEGQPIFELAEALDMAARSGVHVFALCPAVSGSGSWLGDDQVFQAAADELRAEVEAAGGGFWETGRSRSVSAILEAILAQAAGPVDEPPRRIVTDRPEWAIALVAAGLAGLAVWGGWRRRPVWPAVLRRGGAAVLTAVIAWNPTVGVEKVSVQAVDADVVVLVDTSPSLAAEDWDGARPRLEGVKADLAAIGRRYSGARVAIVAFDSQARLAMPLSSDPGAVQAAADTLSPAPIWRASGSSISAGLALLEDLMARLAEEHPERARLVYYLGDGEQTTQAAVESFASVAPLVDGGAVFGYGTAAGGQMLEHHETVLGEPLAPSDYIIGSDGRPGLSRVDEQALAAIAAQLGVAYVHRDADSPVAEALWQGELPERLVEDGSAAGRPLGFIVAWAVFGLAVWELAFCLRRAGQARRALLAGSGAARFGGLGAGARVAAGPRRPGAGGGGAFAGGVRL